MESRRPNKGSAAQKRPAVYTLVGVHPARHFVRVTEPTRANPAAFTTRGPRQRLTDASDRNHANNAALEARGACDFHRTKVEIAAHESQPTHRGFYRNNAARVSRDT